MSRQFCRLQRIKLRTTAQRTLPPSFVDRMTRAHRECPWIGDSEPAIVHDDGCEIERGATCTCTPEVFFTIAGRTIEVDAGGRCTWETQQ